MEVDGSQESRTRVIILQEQCVSMDYFPAINVEVIHTHCLCSYSMISIITVETSSFHFGIHPVPSSFSPPGLVRPVNNHQGKVSTPFLSSSFLFSPCPPSPYPTDKMELPTALVLPSPESPLHPPRTPKLHPPASLFWTTLNSPIFDATFLSLSPFKKLTPTIW